MKIILIACASKKQKKKTKAKNLYASPLFKLNLEYAKSLNPDKIFILSAKHRLLDLEQEIEPYDLTLNKMSANERQKWAEQVLAQLNQTINLKSDKVIFLAGEKYREFLIPELKNHSIPFKGLGIGMQLKLLKEKVENKKKCEKLHILFNKMERHTFPFDNSKIPRNGLYILFEKGEKAHNADRIVRIGTHTGQDQLLSRLSQHFINENKDRSIFRKNIGRALLNKTKDPFLLQWEIDLTTAEAKQKFSDKIDFEKQQETEKQVSKFIQDNFSFIVFPIDDKEQRLRLESKIISTISSCEHCTPTENWLGNHSPKEKIRKGGLWLVNELWKEPLSEDEFIEVEKSLT